jgi:hypothetical protein
VDRALLTLAIVLVVVVLAGLAVVGWRRRVRRDAPAGGGHPAPEVLSAPVREEPVLYVATTKAGQHLERLALPGLAFRGKGTVGVMPEGIRIAVTGEQPVFVPASSLSGVGAATVAIDRAVERDGLLRVSWTTTGGAPADSYFRVVDPAGRAALASAIEDILPATGDRGAEGTTDESEV